ncbi:HipA family kinase [Paraliomyxa miuraensis]|uniref:HipA family kinase n=1 Tax=Paraliomyxa miuraensis TaxID=376150 RepID=UPI00225162BC|nr:HipA family kinase [Paraliomyxa miuraensis]MCX4244498.1 aminotransferase class I and II [Paraliomyxa miuraensis]
MTTDERPPPLRHLDAIRYVTPLREGGSVPAVMELSDGTLHVVKLRGAGQGPRALVAEIIVGQLARALELPAPEVALVTLPDAIARTERDQEIQELLVASVGLNVGLAFLSGALMFDPAAPPPSLDSELASRLVVFDAFVTNVDRTARNPNLLCRQGELWLIDHGAALYWHHDWDGGLVGVDRRFPLTKDHVLLPWADALSRAGDWLRQGLTDARIEAAVADVPAAWIHDDPAQVEPRRTAYASFLRARRDQAEGFLQEAIDARARL